MKLATLNNGTRDGALCVVSRDLRVATIAYDVAPTLQAALDDWSYCAPLLGTLYEDANRDPTGSRWFGLDMNALAAPLPRAFQHIGSYAYIAHLERLCDTVTAADWRKDALLLQRKSIDLLGPREDVPLESDEADVDFAAEIAIVTDDVPINIKREKAAEHIQLFLLGNTITLRKTLNKDLARGYGSFNNHVHTAFGGIAVTPDEFGAAWDGRKLHLRLNISVNDQKLGSLSTAEDMQFDFPTLITRAARTRALEAGTIIGTGAISSRNAENGGATIAEQRALEGEHASTAYLHFGDRLRIEVESDQDKMLFGVIEQQLSSQTRRRLPVNEASLINETCVTDRDTSTL